MTEQRCAHAANKSSGACTSNRHTRKQLPCQNITSSSRGHDTQPSHTSCARLACCVSHHCTHQPNNQTLSAMLIEVEHLHKTPITSPKMSRAEMTPYTTIMANYATSRNTSASLSCSSLSCPQAAATKLITSWVEGKLHPCCAPPTDNNLLLFM
jgi:hypothetical protein